MFIAGYRTQEHFFFLLPRADSHSSSGYVSYFFNALDEIPSSPEVVEH